MNQCGDCKECCDLPRIAETVTSCGNPFSKEKGKLCQFYSSGVGCQIYKDRPPPCRDFRCQWLMSQDGPDPKPHSMRPDKCGIMFSVDTYNNFLFWEGWQGAWRENGHMFHEILPFAEAHHIHAIVVDWATGEGVLCKDAESDKRG